MSLLLPLPAISEVAVTAVELNPLSEAHLLEVLLSEGLPSEAPGAEDSVEVLAVDSVVAAVPAAKSSVTCKYSHN